MRNMFDFSSWSSLITTVLGLLLMTLMMMGVRLLFMQTIQKRRERENRQINERLRTLMAAYKTLGSSFTGNLTVSPVHLRHARAHADLPADEGLLPDADDDSAITGGNSERQRRTRDTVEAALSDIILLGTEEQVRIAAQAAQDMVAPGANRGLGQQLAAVHPRGAVFGSHSARCHHPQPGATAPEQQHGSDWPAQRQCRKPSGCRQPCRWSR